MEFRPTASKLLQNSSSSTFKVSVLFLCDDVLGDDSDDVHDIEVCSFSALEVIPEGHVGPLTKNFKSHALSSGLSRSPWSLHQKEKRKATMLRKSRRR